MFHSLRELWLSHNSLVELPESIGLLLQLRSLDLQYNQLNTLPEVRGTPTQNDPHERCASFCGAEW